MVTRPLPLVLAFVFALLPSAGSAQAGKGAAPQPAAKPGGDTAGEKTGAAPRATGTRKEISEQDRAAAFKHVEFLTRKAVQQFEMLEFDAAKKTLGDAEALCDRFSLSAYAACARVALLQGVLAITAFKDRFAGRKAFVKALTADPSQTIDAALSTPEAEQIFASAKKEAEELRKAAPPPLPVAPPATRDEAAEGEAEPEEVEVDPRDVRGILHRPVPEATRDTQVTIKCVIGPDVNVSKVFLFYRVKGREDWTPEVMSPVRGAYVATIPAAVVRPPAIDYYIEVRDGRGRPQIASGNIISPHQVRVVEPAAPGRTAAAARRPLVEDELDEAARTARRRRSGEGRIAPWIRMALGTGVGWVGKDAKPDAGEGRLEGGGFATAPLHLIPEVGVRLSETLAVSAVGRLQVLTMADQGKTFAAAGLARGYWCFPGARLRPYADVAIGGGYVVHTTDVRDQGGQLVATSFRSGPFLFGIGGGVSYALSPRFVLLGDVQTLVGVPSNFTFHFDVNLGAGFLF